MSYILTQREYRRLKGRLTRALNTRDPRKIRQEARYGLAIFERDGYPDEWSRWQRAYDDAGFALAYGPSDDQER